MDLERIDRIGEGSYGKIYLCEEKDGTRVAYKRNYGDKQYGEYKNLRELSILKHLHHPNIIKLIRISEKSDFKGRRCLSPKPLSDDFEEDKYHFVLELASGGDLEHFISSSKCTPQIRLSLINDIIKGLEFIHKNGIIHCDLTDGNILINDGVANIFAWGLSIFHNKFVKPPRGNTTCTYRAPEVEGGAHYDYSADIWSLGCLIYFILKKRSLFSKADDHDDSNTLVEYLYKNSVQKFDKREVEKYFQHYCHDYNLELPTPNPRSIKSKVMPPKKPLEFDREILETYCDLAQSCLNFFPNKRPTSSEIVLALSLKNDYPIYKSRIKIIDCMERRVAANIVIELVNRGLRWFTQSLQFHSMCLFDRVLEYYYNKHGIPTHEPLREAGVYMTYEDVKLTMHTCIYIVYKFHNVLKTASKYTKFFSGESLKKVEEKQHFIIMEVCKGVVFQKSFLEYLSERGTINKHEAIFWLGKYLNLRKNNLKEKVYVVYEGEMENLYEYLNN